MSWLSDLFGAGRARELSAAPLPVLSGYADSSRLEGLIMAEALGYELSQLPLDRQLAMSVPAVSRGRDLICNAASQLPLTALSDGVPATSQPTFLYRSDSAQTPQERIERTVDDLIFHGDSLWVVKRGSKSDGSAYGPILDAVWVPRNRWTVEPVDSFTNRVLVDGNPVAEDSVIHFYKGDGLLARAHRTLKGYIALEGSVLSKTRNPIPLTVIQHSQQSAGDLEPEEIGNLLRDWGTARRSEDGAVGYLPFGLEIQTHGQVQSDLFETGRNAYRLDIANFMNIPAVMLDGSLSTSTLTYSTVEGQANRFFTETMPGYLGVIERRLSKDDVVPRGQSVRFDTSQLTVAPASPTGAPVED